MIIKIIEGALKDALKSTITTENFAKMIAKAVVKAKPEHAIDLGVLLCAHIVKEILGDSESGIPTLQDRINNCVREWKAERGL